MNHTLGDTSSLIRGLVLGIRPSIAWRLGMAVAPLDILTTQGNLGWEVGVRMILKRHRRTPDRTPASVLSWLETRSVGYQPTGDTSFELVESLRWSLGALRSDRLSITTNDFVQCWSRNVNEIAKTRRSGQASYGVRVLAQEALQELECWEGTEQLQRALSVFDDKDLRASRSANPATTPRLNASFANQSDWLAVLGGFEVLDGFENQSETENWTGSDRRAPMAARS